MFTDQDSGCRPTRVHDWIITNYYSQSHWLACVLIEKSSNRYYPKFKSIQQNKVSLLNEVWDIFKMYTPKTILIIFFRMSLWELIFIVSTMVMWLMPVTRMRIEGAGAEIRLHHLSRHSSTSFNLLPSCPHFCLPYLECFLCAEPWNL